MLYDNIIHQYDRTIDITLTTTNELHLLLLYNNNIHKFNHTNDKREVLFFKINELIKRTYFSIAKMFGFRYTTTKFIIYRL